MNDPNRRTGRTTRMLEAAIEAAREGQTVLVVASDERQVSYLRNMLDLLAPNDEARITAMVRIEPFQKVVDGRLRGHRFGRFYEDHHAEDVRRQSGLFSWDWAPIVLPLIEAGPDGSAER